MAVNFAPVPGDGAIEVDLPALRDEASPRRLANNPGLQPVDPTALPEVMPVTNLDLDVTENCNLGCVYCFKGEKFPQNMSLETAKQAVEWLLQASARLPSVNVNFMGGEPTMRWDLISSLVPWAHRRALARGKRITFSMTSNLTLWTQEIRDFVDRWGFGVLMSIDGCPEVQDSQRPAKNGRPMSSVIEHWARSMLRTRPNSTARATLHPKWTPKLFESVEYLRGIGFKEVALSSSSYEEWTDENYSELLERQLPRVNRLIIDEHIAGRPFNLTVYKYYIRLLILPRSLGETPIFRHQPCGAGRGMAMIDNTGDIWPCHRFDGADEDADGQGAFRLGNIFKPGYNHELQAAFVSFDHEVQCKPTCKTCPVNEVCGGYCPAANLSSTGSIYTPADGFCRWSWAMYENAVLVFEALCKDPRTRELLLESVKEVTSDGQR